MMAVFFGIERRDKETGDKYCAVKRAFDVLHAGRDVEPVTHALAEFREEAVQVGQGDNEDAKQRHQHAAAQYGRKQLHCPSVKVYVIPHS